jgi:hypothetical protein
MTTVEIYRARDYYDQDYVSIETTCDKCGASLSGSDLMYDGICMDCFRQSLLDDYKDTLVEDMVEFYMNKETPDIESAEYVRGCAEDDCLDYIVLECFEDVCEVYGYSSIDFDKVETIETREYEDACGY